MSPTIVVGLIEQLRCQRLVSPTQLEELERLVAPLCGTANDLAVQLVNRRLLNAFQAEQLVLGGDLVLDDYLLMGKLGEGGMGVVYKAWHRLMRRDVALKLVRPERLARPQLRERFLREIRSFGQLSHSNVVTAFDAGQVGDRCFLVMELLEGMDLAKLVRAHGRLPVATACDYARQAALGLAHAHQRGVVHRDIKPSNLLRTTDEVVKILDLGLAHLCLEEEEGSTADPLTPAGTGMGTPDFLAPEQAIDAQRADTRSDLYSLGCTLYFLLTGSVPYPGGSATGKLLRHQTDTPQPLEDLRPDAPASVAAAVRKLMARLPEDRYQTATEVVAALSCPEPLPETGPGPSQMRTPVAAPAPLPAANGEQQSRVGTATAPEPPAAWWRRFALPALLVALALLASASILFWRLNWWTPGGPDKSGSPEGGPGAQSPDAPPGLLHPPCKGHFDWVKAVAFLPPQGQTVISGGADGLRLWKVDDGMQLPGSPVAIRGALKLAVSPNGNHIAVGTQRPPVSLVVWEASAGVRPIEGLEPKMPVRDVAFSPNGSQLAAAGFDNWVHVYETSSRRGVHHFEVGGGDVLGLCYLPDGQRILTARKDSEDAGGPGLTVQVWNPKKGVLFEQKQFPIKEPYCVAFSPDGEFVLAADADHSLVLCEIATGNVRKPLRGHFARLQSLAISPDGSRALSGGGALTRPNPPEDCAVRLWDLKEGKQIYITDPVEAPIACVRFSPDGRIAAAGTESKKVYLWRLPGPR
jgi:eukaryotic-like serine/threonine-protein kinase